MKKYLLVLYILLFTFTLGAASTTNSVSITLTTSVPGYLYHGFLSSVSSTGVESSATVEDAFNPEGAVLKYGIKTNTGLPLIVHATIQDFTQQGDVPQPATISISKVDIDPEEGSSTTLPYNSANTYQLLTLDPTSGTVFYPYTLTVYANQTQVQNSPSGTYQSTVKINIGIND